MSVVAITSSRTSPGATTLAAGLAIAWSHLVDQALLIEADPAGGVLALRFDLAPAPSLTSFGSDVRNSYEPDLVWANTQDLRGVRCMPGPVDPMLARSWIDRIAPTLVTELPRLGAPVVVDLGWMDHGGVSTPLASAADTTLIVTRPDVAEIQALLFQVRRLQATDTNVAIVTIGDSPNDPQEIARIAGAPLAAVLPDDPKVADALAGGKFKPSKFRRSMLWRSISGLATSLLDQELLEHRATSLPVFDSSVASSDGAGFEDMRGSLDQLAPEALRSNPPIPTVHESLRQPQMHAPVSALAIPGPAPTPSPASVAAVIPPPPSAASVAAALAPPSTASVAAVIPPPSAASVAAALAPKSHPLPSAPAASVPVAEPVVPTIVVIDNFVPARASYPSTTPNDPGLFEDTSRLGDRPSSVPLTASLVLPTGEAHLLGEGQAFTIGRHSECDIVLNDSQVSRRHGRLVHTGEGWHYADLGSRNGTEINGLHSTDTVLAAHDILTIGRTALTFHTTSQREMECA